MTQSMELQRVTSAEHQGRRLYQEDRHFFFTAAEGHCFGVFDGHGDAQCAHFCAERFPLIFIDLLTPAAAPIPNVLLQALHQLSVETEAMESGSTASIVFIPLAGDEVHVAVLGDSPVIVKQADKSIWVAPEHNVRTNKAEARAVRSRGGMVDRYYLYASFNGPGLQLARALGDVSFSRVISRVPDISSHKLAEGSFVFVGTDGALNPAHLQAKKSMKALVKFIEGGADAQAIVDRALAIPTEDNVTAFLVRVE